MSRLELEELPDDHGAATPGGPVARRPPGARRHPAARLIVGLALLALLGALLRYALPASDEPAARGAMGVVERAVSAATSQAKVLWDRVREALGAVLTTKAQRQALKERQRKAHLRDAEREEAAWDRFFQRSPKCAVEANQTSVDCVNEVIRARREFDRRWAAGEL